MLSPAFFLVVTVCVAQPDAGSDFCDDYLIDGNMSYSDCQKELASKPFDEQVFSIRCDRGEIVEETEE